MLCSNQNDDWDKMKMRRKICLYLISAATIVCLLFIFCGCLSITRVKESHYSDADASLINPDADDCAKELMRYLKSVYGTKVIAGQYINEYADYSAAEFQADPDNPDSPSTVFNAHELKAVYSVTGEYPALLGLDVSGIESGDPCYSVGQAVEWHNAGGIVTICWHWKIDNMDGNPRAFYTQQTSFSLAAALADKGGNLYKGLISDIDAVAEALKPLAVNGVPVLWRPLHEASGGWFWWGASGEDAYKELWDILYDRMTNVHKLNNLIWVYNGQDKDWYVGDDKCDIIGDDPYYDYNSRESYEKDPANSLRFKTNYKYGENKMIMMSENDFVFDIDAAFRENTRWLTFCTWCREFVCEYENEYYNTLPFYSGRYTSSEELKAAYDNEKTITLSRLVASGEYKI